ncbi:uncharacterized protein LOC129590664 isoform X2 [Paramacrobiotus metropolitanus]|uniref:uncharacterized protein LOC129590664 isoform X2 n=1 Tax=Paramacrobiotus metropolitanus TaxID=2943436 RepID=UPI002445B8B9|nr:uncharacterized protein LOC129590664 isoform X2 [Paramacrobiotus metropolitanus]
MGNRSSVVEIIGSNMGYRYSNGDLIGSGSFNPVYKAGVSKRADYTGGDTIAVKVSCIKFYSHSRADIERWEKAVKRLRLLTQLAHGNLVAYHKITIFKAPSEAIVEMAMDYHKNLAKFLKEVSKNDNLHILSYYHFIGLARDLNRGLAFLHSNGIAHGDLKPANILVKARESCSADYLMIADLGGLEQIQDDAVSSRDFSHLRGTPRYMSPERLKKFARMDTDAPGRAADIWSLGCIILDMAECSKRVPEKRLIKDGVIINAGSHLNDNQFADLIVQGYVPFVCDDIESHVADLIRECLLPVSADRISAKLLLTLLNIF